MLVNSKTEIVPIDHALCLPPINCLGEAELTLDGAGGNNVNCLSV